VLGKLPAQLGGAGAKAVEEHLFDSTKKHAENFMTPNTKTWIPKFPSKMPCRWGAKRSVIKKLPETRIEGDRREKIENGNGRRARLVGF
jgi:hypothetical protein